jgi:hypothetical protein
MVVSIMVKGAGSVEVPARPAVDFRKAHQDLVLHLQCLLRLGHRHARLHGRRHVEQRALAQGRHEFRTELEVDRQGQCDNRQAGDHRELGVPDHESAWSLVDPVQEVADGVPFLGVVLAHHDLAGQPGERSRPESERLDPREQHAHGWVQRNG